MRRNVLLAAVLAIFVSAFLMAGGGKQSSGAANSNRPKELSMFVNFTWYPTDSWSGIVPEEITKRTGVHINVTRAVDGQQLGLMLASGDLPDLVYSDGLLERFTDESIAHPYNKLIAQYAPNWKVDPMLIANAKLSNKQGDNNFYFIRNNFNTAKEYQEKGHGMQLPTTIIRGDIYEALGKPPIETPDDFMKVLGMVKQRYPNLIPWSFANWHNDPFATALGIPTSGFGEENGKAFYYINHPRYKDFLRYVNQIYRNGYMLADNFSLSATDAESIFYNAQAFAKSGSSSFEPYTNGVQASRVDPAAWSTDVVLKTPDLKFYNAGVGWAGIVITKKCSDPEAAVKFMEFMWSVEGQRLSAWGREGIDWTMGSNGLPVFSQDWKDAYADTPVFDKKYNANWYFNQDAITEYDGRVAAVPPEFAQHFQAMLPYVYVCPWLTAAQPVVGTEERNILDRLNDMVTSANTKCFLAENNAEFERYYNELMTTAKSIGIDRLETYVNGQLPRYKAMYQ